MGSSRQWVSRPSARRAGTTATERRRGVAPARKLLEAGGARASVSPTSGWLSRRARMTGSLHRRARVCLLCAGALGMFCGSTNPLASIQEQGTAQPDAPYVDPHELLSLDGAILFAAWSAASGSELWRLDELTDEAPLVR